ncbi:MAG: 50S ribosomal protein L21 [Parachlamydiales bacterium]|jgi:large subunit ribosomal protein L21
MYAIIETGGKQYWVREGDVIDIDLILESKNIKFEQVLLIQDENTTKIGAPTLEKTLVLGEVLEEIKGPKIIAYKYKKRKRSTRKKKGHRQKYSRVKITAIKLEKE